MAWWLIIIGLWVAPAIVLAGVLLLTVGRDRLSRRCEPKNSTHLR